MFATTEGGPPNVGQTIIAMDPAFYSDGFVAHLESMFTDLTKDNEVRVPGELSIELRRLHEAEKLRCLTVFLRRLPSYPRKLRFSRSRGLFSVAWRGLRYSVAHPVALSAYSACD